MYTPLDETMLQLGLYDYVWGDNSMLQNYLSRVEAEKNRNEQRAYNDYLKAYDEAKANREEEARKADEQRQRDAEKARLYKQYNEAEGASERAVIAKQIAVLEGRDAKNTKTVKDEMLNAYDEDRVAKEKADKEERERKHNALDTLAKIDHLKTTAGKNKTARDKLAKSIATDEKAFPYLTQEERDKIVADIRGIKTLDEMMQDAAQQAVVQNTGKLTADKLEWQNVLRRSKEPGYVPSTEDKAVAKKNNFYWDKKLKDYVKIGAK